MRNIDLRTGDAFKTEIESNSYCPYSSYPMYTTLVYRSYEFGKHIGAQFISSPKPPIAYPHMGKVKHNEKNKRPPNTSAQGNHGSYNSGRRSKTVPEELVTEGTQWPTQPIFDHAYLLSFIIPVTVLHADCSSENKRGKIRMCVEEFKVAEKKLDSLFLCPQDPI